MLFKVIKLSFCAFNRFFLSWSGAPLLCLPASGSQAHATVQQYRICHQGLGLSLGFPETPTSLN